MKRHLWRTTLISGKVCHLVEDGRRRLKFYTRLFFFFFTNRTAVLSYSNVFNLHAVNLSHEPKPQLEVKGPHCRVEGLFFILSVSTPSARFIKVFNYPPR